jgi:hypothetical protein
VVDLPSFDEVSQHGHEEASVRDVLIIPVDDVNDSAVPANISACLDERVAKDVRQVTDVGHTCHPTARYYSKMTL